MQPLIRRPRQLWNQVLYREVAATALTVKAGADALDMVRKLLSLDPACLQSASVDALRAPHPCHESLNHEGDKSGSLVVARVSQEHRKGVTAWKVAACSCWSLPPGYARTLTRWWQSSWADLQALIDVAKADVATTANTCPREALQLPERFDRGNAGAFLLRCHLTVQSPIQCVIRSSHMCPNQQPLQGSCFSD